MPYRNNTIARTSIAALVALSVFSTAPTWSLAVEIEGVQPAALDQPRVHVCLRRDLKGKPLAAADNGGAGGAGAIGKALGLDVGALGGQPFDVQVFLDTGASGILLSKTTAAALGVRRATATRGEEVVFHDVGVGGGETFGVSEPLFVAVAPGGSTPNDADGYNPPFGPVRAQISIGGGGLIEQLTGGLDVVGMPAIKGHILVLDPRPVDTFADTMRADLLDPRRDRARVPKADRTVALSYASFVRFTHTEPAGAQGPTLADNPFVGPSPTTTANSAATKPAAAKAPPPPITVMLNGKTSTGSWLLDTGAAASMISTAQAKRLGVSYRESTRDTATPVLEGVPEANQFTFTIGGIGGQKTSAGFFLDALTLPTREGDGIIYKGAPVLVADITVEDPASHEKVTLDGVLGMNFFVASANIKQAGLMPDINQLTAGPYQAIVFDEPAATLGLKFKPDIAAEAAKGIGGAKRGTVDIKPTKPGRVK